MSVPIVDSALKLLTEGIAYFNALQKSKRVRKMVAAIKWATEYIEICHDIDESDNPKEIKKLNTRRRYAERKFEKYKCY